MYSVIWNQFTQRLWNDHTLIIHTHPGPMGLRVPSAQNSLIFAVQGAGKAQGQTYEPQIGNPTKAPKKCGEVTVLLSDWTPPRPTPTTKKHTVIKQPCILTIMRNFCFCCWRRFFAIFAIKELNYLFLVQAMSPGTSLSVPTMPKSNCVPFRASPEKLSPDRTSSGEKNKMVTLFHVDVTVVGDLE